MHAAHLAGCRFIRLRSGSAGAVRLSDGRTVAIRPARPADAEAVQQFVRTLSPLARRRRFFGALTELSPAQLDRLVGTRNSRHLCLVAVTANPGEPRIVAMAQYAADAPEAAEFAVVVADAWQRQGLATRLLGVLLERARLAGIRAMNGFTLAENGPMLALAARLGFALAEDRDPDLVRLERPLPPPARAARFAGRLRRLALLRDLSAMVPLAEAAKA